MLVLVEKQKDNQIVEYPLDVPIFITAEPGAVYSIKDTETDLPPEDMVLKKKGNVLEVEVDGETVAQVEAFFAPESEILFSTDGTLTPADDLAVTGDLAVPGDDGYDTLVVWQPDDSGTAKGWMAGLGVLGGIGLAAAAASGGSGGDDATPADDSTSYVISINAAAGAFSSTLQVQLYDQAGNLIVETDHDFSTGSFSYQITNGYTGFVFAKVTDLNDVADYLDETSGTLTNLGTTLRAMAMADGQGNVSLTVTPLTELAVQLAGIDEDNLNLTGEDLAYNEKVGDLFGVDDITGPVTTVTEEAYDSSDGLNAAEQYGNVLAMLSGVDEETGSVEETIAQIKSAIVETETQDSEDSALGLTEEGVELLQQGVDNYTSGETGNTADLSDLMLQTPLIDAAGDGGITAQEKDAGVVVALSDVSAGDTVTVYWGDQTYQETVSSAQLNTQGQAEITIPSSVIGAAGDADTLAVTYSVNGGDKSPAVIITVDTQVPVIQSVSLPNTTMLVGDTVTVTITVDSDTDTYTAITGTIGGFTLSNLVKVNDTTYEAEFTITQGGTDVAAGNDIPVNITLTDTAGNTGTAYTTAISQDSDAIDANAPVITAVSIPNTAMSVGNTVTVTITVEDDGGETYTNIQGSVGGFALSGLARVNSNTYTAQFTVTESGTDVAAGSGIPVNITLDDTNGGTSAAYTTAISQDSDSIDANAPVISSVSIADTTMNVGDVVPVTITVADDGGDTYTNLSGTIGGFTLSNLSRTNSTTYTAQFTVTEGGTDVSAGDDIPVSLTLDDGAGNTSTTYSTAISQDSDQLDANSPVISGVSIADTTMKVGETVTVTITVADDGGDTYTNLSGTVAGYSLSNFTRVNSTSYTAQFTISQGDSDVAAVDDISVNITLEDSSGNTSNTYTTSISQANDNIDANAPVITAVSIANSAMNVGDTVTATITVSSDTDTYTAITGTIGGFTLSNLTKTSDTTYTAQFTVTDGGTDVAAGQDIPVSLTLTDSAGNVSSTYDTAISQDSDAIDANSPTLDSVTPADDATGVAADTSLTLTFSEAVSAGTGYLTIKLAGDDSTFETIDITGGQVTGWGTTTLTVDPSGTFSDNTGYYVVFDGTAILDANGSPAAAITDKTQWSFSTPDNTAPQVASFTSTTSDGSYKAGDTIEIVATMNEDIKSGSEMTVTLDTGETVTLTASADGTTLTGTYTVQAGVTSSDLAVTGFTVGTVQDLAGNALADTSLPATNIDAGSDIVIDTTAPTIDTVTAGWGDSLNAAEDDGDGTVTVSTTGVEDGQQVTVTLNGTDYTGTVTGNSAAVTITASGLQALTNGQSYSLAVNVSDAAGNAATTANSTGFTVDTTAPTANFSTATDDEGSVTGTLSDGDVTDDTALVLSGICENGSTVAVYNGTTKIGDAVVAGTTWTYTAGVVDGTTYQFNVKETDVAGNVSAATSNFTVTGDTTAPTANLSAATDDAGSVTGTLSDGDATDDTALVLSGTCESSSTVAVYNGTTKIGDAAVSGTTWTYTAEVVDGTTYQFNVTETDAAGNESVATTDFTVTGDTTAPDITAISGAAWNNHENTIILTGSDFVTLLESGENSSTDIKARLDWSDITWDIDGDNAATTDVTFSLADIASACVTADDTLVITLTSDKVDSVQQTANYANIDGNAADTLDISSGFFGDLAGNTSDFSADDVSMTGQPTKYTSFAVVTSNGIFYDYDRDGIKDAGEDSIPATALSAWLNDGSKTIEFDAVPNTPINLTGFGADDVLNIDISEYAGGAVPNGNTYSTKNVSTYISSTFQGTKISIHIRSYNTATRTWASASQLFISRTVKNTNSNSTGNVYIDLFTTIASKLAVAPTASNVFFV